MTIHVNNIDIYYEKAGSGPPVILLHGNGETHKIFRVATQRLAEKYTVYAIDSRGHGKSGRVKALHYADMAEDVARFIEKVGLERPMLYGFSDGGIVALLLAIKYPALLSRLAVSGANLNPRSLSRGFLRFSRAMYAITRGCRWKLMLSEPDITEEELSRIEAPVLVLAGGKDIVEARHTRIIAGAIPGARLRILPGEGHASYVVNSPKLVDILEPFFEEGYA
ncbi:MAG: alpha/beta hydrolase [Oscillospiraceae bacterium]|nr:alpha/beta hydrolase [Oscillospiraceae bacterium]